MNRKVFGLGVRYWRMLGSALLVAVLADAVLMAILWALFH